MIAVVVLLSAAAFAQQVPQTFKIQPLRPVEELQAAALKVQPPAETGDFLRPDLVELIRLDPTLKLNIRYASSDNFLSTPVYTEARAFMQRRRRRRWCAPTASFTNRAMVYSFSTDIVPGT